MSKDKLKVVTEYHKIRHQLHMPTKVHKNKKRYNRKDKNWRKEEKMSNGIEELKEERVFKGTLEEIAKKVAKEIKEKRIVVKIDFDDDGFAWDYLHDFMEGHLDIGLYGEHPVYIRFVRWEGDMGDFIKVSNKPFK